MKHVNSREAEPSKKKEDEEDKQLKARAELLRLFGLPDDATDEALSAAAEKEMIFLPSDQEAREVYRAVEEEEALHREGRGPVFQKTIGAEKKKAKMEHLLQLRDALDEAVPSASRDSDPLAFIEFEKRDGEFYAKFRTPLGILSLEKDICERLFPNLKAKNQLSQKLEKVLQDWPRGDEGSSY